MNRGVRHRPFFIRLFHWEYWPFGVVYGPIYPVWLWFCLRARSFFFFSAANPAIRNGGFLNESKKEVYALADPAWQPRTMFFERDAETDMVLRRLAGAGFRFPLIGKPDVGGRGRGVKKLETPADVEAYARRATMPYHIQEFSSFENEIGVFYCRYPGSETGFITGIVRKEFLSVTGDGRSSVGELMRLAPRALLQHRVLLDSSPALLEEVPAAGEKRIVVPYGNHARGAAFYDDTARAGSIAAAIDRLCRGIDRFHYGRLDIRYADWDALAEGRDFSVIEVNGAGSEPTHMYDPRHSLFFAWKEIIRHWRYLYRISRMNHTRGVPYLSLREGVHMFRDDKAYAARLKQMG